MTDQARRSSPAARIVRGLATLLESPSATGLAALAAAATDEKDWPWIKRLITIHGLAPHLFRGAGAAELGAVLPAPAFAWLAEHDALNAQRIDRLHAELAAILAAAAQDGIDVIPLKGALLTTMPGSDPHRRPMGDIDLLIRPFDRPRMAALLARLGYRHEPEANPRPTHDVYVDPGGGRVVSRDEHPDNPRRVELHVELLRHLWGWLDEDRLTEMMWASATPGEILGQPALLPHPRFVLAHVAIHATADLLVGRGRLVQWLDIAQLAVDQPGFDGQPDPRLAYPSLRLASRAMPKRLAGLRLDALAAGIPPRLVRWAASVPLDQRSGLMIGPQRVTPHSLAARAARWAPVSWRLLVAYGDRPRPVALALHARRVAGRWRGRFRYRQVPPESG